MIIGYISSIIALFAFSVVLRSLLGGIVGSSSVRSKKYTRICVFLPTFFYLIVILAGLVPERLEYFIGGCLASISIYILFRFSDLREEQKNPNKKEGKYMWENILDSL